MSTSTRSSRIRDEIFTQLAGVQSTGLEGRVVQTLGATLAVADFAAPVGAVVEIHRASGRSVPGEVIGFRDALTLVAPLGDLPGVRRGDRVRLVRSSDWLAVGDGLIGRVFDAFGRPLDSLPVPPLPSRTYLHAKPPQSTRRRRVAEPFTTGVRSIDAMLTCGRGQRLGVFAGAGVGKSVLLGMLAKNAQADVIVVGLVGERGREVQEFLERDLGPEGLARSVVFVATSDESPLVRVRAALAATSVAEHFASEGRDVLLVLDSLTRVALALREIGLSAGEPPATRGFPASVFTRLPQLVERTGPQANGVITAFYSVLVEGDDPNDPIGDAVRGLLDGHVWLSRRLANRGCLPAIDVLESVSRCMNSVTTRDHQEDAAALRSLLSTYRENEELISLGAYTPGSKPQVDAAIALHPLWERFAKQRPDESATMAEALGGLKRLHAAIAE
ncbi:MAG TPA: FliI/YscN family ATPase [Pirellulales bacterium]